MYMLILSPANFTPTLLLVYNCNTFLLPYYMTSKIVTPTSKGQITLPKEWRNQFKTGNYILETSDREITIKPVYIETDNEEVLFDADRDNKGKGITPDEMIKMLKKIQRG